VAHPIPSDGIVAPPTPPPPGSDDDDDAADDGSDDTRSRAITIDGLRSTMRPTTEDRTGPAVLLLALLAFSLL
jgi:hypothetical protein